MKFPTMVYGALVDQFKIVAGADQDLVVGDVTPLHLRWHGPDVAGTMTALGTPARVEEIEFRFELPPSPES